MDKTCSLGVTLNCDWCDYSCDTPYSVVIFFSLTEPPLPHPTPTPSNTPRLDRSRPERTESDRNGPKRTEMDRIGHFASSLGWGTRRGLSARGGGGCKGKENHYYGGIPFGAQLGSRYPTPLTRAALSGGVHTQDKFAIEPLGRKSAIWLRYLIFAIGHSAGGGVKTR